VLDLLRDGLKPDLMIFLDGVNEKQGWLQASSCDKRNYEQVSWQYKWLSEICLGGKVPTTIGWKRLTITKIIGDLFHRVNPPRKSLDGVNQLRFVQNQAERYSKTFEFIKKLSNDWQFKVQFFLEPTLWDVWHIQKDMHYEYMRLLYQRIVSMCDEVVDLSATTKLVKENFIEWKHVDSAGTNVLAKQIYDYIIGLDNNG